MKLRHHPRPNAAPVFSGDYILTPTDFDAELGRYGWRPLLTVRDRHSILPQDSPVYICECLDGSWCSYMESEVRAAVQGLEQADIALALAETRD